MIMYKLYDNVNPDAYSKRLQLQLQLEQLTSELEVMASLKYSGPSYVSLKLQRAYNDHSILMRWQFIQIFIYKCLPILYVCRCQPCNTCQQHSLLLACLLFSAGAQNIHFKYISETCNELHKLLSKSSSAPAPYVVPVINRPRILPPICRLLYRRACL